MIAAAAHKTAWSLNQIPCGWFDLVLVGVLAFGYWRGRTRGMSREFLSVFQCLITLVSASFGYQPLGKILIQQGAIKALYGQHFNELTAAYMTSYLSIVFVIFMIFSPLKRAIRAKIEGTNAFGHGEYYLGMLAGMFRYASITLMVLALIHAPLYTAAEIAQLQAEKNATYGGGMKGFSGDFFPSPDEFQSAIFKQSLFGPIINRELSPLLIDSVPPAPAKKKIVPH